MKRKLLIGLCLLGMTQTFAQSRVNPGIRGGWTISNLSGIEADYRSNFYLGLQLPITLTKFYTLQPEVNYTRQGADNVSFYDYNFDVRTRESNLSMDYIDLNVINKFHFGKLNLQVGPGLGFLTNASETGVTRVDMTLNLGVGIDLTKRLGIEARWKPGLINVDNDIRTFNNYNTYFYYSDYITNNVFQIGAYFTL